MSDRTTRKDRKWYLLLTLPAFVLYAFALVVPLIKGTIPNSLTNWNLISGARRFVGLQNYVNLLHDQDFIQSLVFTLVLGIFTIIGTNLIAFTVAMFLSDRIFANSLSRAMFFIPNIISGVMVAFVWVFIFTQALPVVGKTIGLRVLQDTSWFGTPTMATVATIIVSIWQGTGFLMVLYIAGLQTISTDVLEAAKLDGATGLKKVIHIQLPLLMPTITISLFVSIANAFKAFDIPFALTGGGPGGSTQTMALDIYNDAFGSFRYGYASAKSVILFLLVAIVTGIQLYITRGKEESA